MAKKSLAAFREVSAEHRRLLDRLLDRGGVARLRPVYDRAEAELAAKLRRLSRGGRGASMTAHQARIALSQVRDGQARMAAAMAHGLGEVSRDAQAESLGSLASSIAKLERRYRGAEVVLPVTESARFQGVVDGRRTSLMRAHRTSMARYGARLVGDMEDEISASLLQAETVDEMVARVASVAESEWWQAERIVRTETAWAYNATAVDGAKEAAEEIPGLLVRWNENCDDETGEPLDERVGVDSIAMHGQVTDPGGLFTMPATAPHPALGDKKARTAVSDDLVGRSWEFPPDRPNDRASVDPWHPDWGVPGWRYADGRRAPVRVKG